MYKKIIYLHNNFEVLLLKYKVKITISMLILIIIFINGCGNKNNNQEKIIETSNKNVETEQIKSDTKITVNRIYRKCGHTEPEIITPPHSYGGKNLDNINVYFPGAEIESKNNEEIRLNIIKDGLCNQHYEAKLQNNEIIILRENDGSVINKINVDVKILPSNDVIELLNGIKIDTKEDLQEFVQDFSS